MTPFVLCAEFGGPLLAPELTDEKDRTKMTGSLMFFEAESIEEVRKIVESDIYYTSGMVRLTFPSAIIQSISFFDFDLVGQGKNQYLTFCTGDALAIELEDTAMARTVIVVIVTHPRSQYHHSPKVRVWGNPHVYLMIIAPSNVKSFVTPRVLTPAATRYAHVHLNPYVESSSLSNTSREGRVLSLES